MALIPCCHLSCNLFAFNFVVGVVVIKHCIHGNLPNRKTSLTTSAKNYPCLLFVLYVISPCHRYYRTRVSPECKYWLIISLFVLEYLLYVPNFNGTVLRSSDELVWCVEMDSSHTIHVTLETTSRFELNKRLSL